MSAPHQLLLYLLDLSAPGLLRRRRRRQRLGNTVSQTAPEAPALPALTLRVLWNQHEGRAAPDADTLARARGERSAGSAAPYSVSAPSGCS